MRGTQYWGTPVLEGPELKREGAGARVWPTLQAHVLWVSKAPSASAPGEQAEGQAGPAQGKGIHRPHVRNSPHLPTSTLCNVHCAPPPFYKWKLETRLAPAHSHHMGASAPRLLPALISRGSPAREPRQRCLKGPQLLPPPHQSSPQSLLPLWLWLLPGPAFPRGCLQHPCEHRSFLTGPLLLPLQ